MGGNLDMLQVLCSVPDMSTEDTQVSNEELSELHIMKHISPGSYWGSTQCFPDMAAHHCKRKVYFDLLYFVIFCSIDWGKNLPTRSNLLRAWYNLCVSHQQELARILTAEQGCANMFLEEEALPVNGKYVHKKEPSLWMDIFLFLTSIYIREAIGRSKWRNWLWLFIYRVVQVQLVPIFGNFRFRCLCLIHSSNPIIIPSQMCFSEEARRVGGEVAASPTRTKEMIFIR